MKNEKNNAVPVSEVLEEGRAPSSLRVNLRSSPPSGHDMSWLYKEKSRLEAGATKWAEHPATKWAEHADRVGTGSAGLYNGSSPVTKNDKLDAETVWKQIEDVVVPKLRLSVIDHVVYFHLVRHSRLEGKRRLRFSIPWLARNIHLSVCPTREAIRRLAALGALRLVERSKAGHVADVRLPGEIRGVCAKTNRAHNAARLSGATDIEDVNFLKALELRRTIHAREGGKCFYCLRRVPARLACLDHVVPRARVRCNSYRNLVSSCMECNSEKGERPAGEFLRWLFREHQLGAADLKDRFRALELLAAGKLRPVLPSEDGRGSQEA